MLHPKFHLARFIHVLFFSGVVRVVFAQVPWCEVLPSTGPQLLGGPWPSCGTHFDYFPDATTLPKVVKVNVHFMLNSNGEGNFTATGDNLGGTFTGFDYATILVDQINAHTQVNWQMNLPPGNATPSLPLKYGFQLMGVYYHTDNNFFNANQFSSTCVTTYGVNTSEEINIFFVYDQAAAPGTFPTNAGAATTSGLRYVKIQGAWQTYAAGGDFGNAYQEARLVLHELTHCLTLTHTLLTAATNQCANVNDLCSDTPSYQEMINLGVPAPYGCCTAGPTCSNNLMDYNADWALTPEQLGHIHKTLSTELLPFLVDEYCSASTSPIVIPAGPTITWSGSKILTSDVIVEDGATLVVKCNVHLPSSKKVIVQPGGKLVVDGGLFTNLCGDFWGGIEVWGTTNQHQFPADHPTYQGILVLKNGAVIEHAREGAQNWKPEDWSTRGGVIQVQGTHAQIGGTFRNCRRALRFMKYQNYLQGHPDVRLPDNSFFNYARFEYDEDYREEDYVSAAVTMWGTYGIVFKACSFENMQQTGSGFADLSSKLGKGIYSEDASYTVRGSCNTTGLPYGTPCPVGQLDRSEFIGFDDGISAFGTAGSSASFAVYDTDFKDNVCGVYAKGVVGYQVKRCAVEIGGRVVLMDNEDGWNEYQRGIYSTESWAFAVDDNTITPSGSYPLREGIVIGYNRDHNDVVFRNDISGLEVGYVGEGIAASTNPSYTATLGLQFLCNQNNGNEQNFWSRLVTGAPSPEQDDHTIRTNQGYSYRPADNTFDQVPGPLGVADYEVTTTNGTITYWHRNTGDLVPIHVRQSVNPPCYLGPVTALNIPSNNCAGKIMHTIPPDPGHPSGMALQDIQDYLNAEKIAYGNTRYLYDGLVDGGSTDEVVQEIVESWPQNAWELRSYLLDLSPFLSVEALKGAMLKPYFPEAMKAEVCIANPEATQKEGFLDWLRDVCPYPLPEYMIANIVASWEERTYRGALEAEMAYHHAEMSQAANMLIHRHAEDEDGASPEELRGVWQQVRTPAARYAEAATWLDEGKLEEAADVIENIPLEHDLRTPEMLERQRMLDLIEFLVPIRTAGRTDAQLTVGEIADLEALRGDAYDRPATWISNLLCFHYDICRPDLTGGEQGGRKSLQSAERSANAPKDLEYFTLRPNPAEAWAVVTYQLPGAASTTMVSMRDLAGREVLSLPLKDRIGQVLLDTRNLAPGAYQVTLVSGGSSLQTETIILRQ